MPELVVKRGNDEYVIDCERSEQEYRDLLSSFMQSDLFTCNPFNLSDKDLDAILERRSNAYVKHSWLGTTGHFFSRCRLDKVVHIHDEYPWEQLSFQPWQHFPVITMNRFRREMHVLLEKEHRILPAKKKYEVLGCQEDTTALSYFEKNVGKSFIYCYGFNAVDSYSPHRFCIRFAEDSFKREALLLTGLFSINYLLNHPFECFPNPYIAHTGGWVIEDIEAMSVILNPIMEEEKPALLEIQNRLKEEVRVRHLQSEEI